MFSKEIQIEAVSLYLKGVPTVIIRKKFEIKGSGTTSLRAYFTAYIDVYSGEILTWNIDLHPTVEFVTKPLDELLQNRPDLIIEWQFTLTKVSSIKIMSMYHG